MIAPLARIAMISSLACAAAILLPSILWLHGWALLAGWAAYFAAAQLLGARMRAAFARGESKSPPAGDSLPRA